MDPCDYSTWTSFAEHPVFSGARERIAEWSYDPSRYGDLASYSRFMAEWYVHVEPKLPIEEQELIADRDLRNLREACRLIDEWRGPIEHELIILDDFTAYVRLEANPIVLEVHPLLPDQHGILGLEIEQPHEREVEIQELTEIVPSLEVDLSSIGPPHPPL